MNELRDIWSAYGERAVYGACIVLCIIVLVLSLRGIAGNPTHETLNNSEWRDEGPLELSPDRGRFALTFSMVEDGSLQFSLPVARFATPDVAVTPDGRHYVSLFAPGLSVVTMPGYLVGRVFGLAQVGTFAMIAMIACLNVLLIRTIAVRLGASSVAGLLGGLTFLLGTPALTYSVTLYQHHLSVLIILLGIYLLLRSQSAWSLAGIWFLCAASVPIDNPNLFLMFPIGLAALVRTIWFERGPSGGLRRLMVRPIAVLALAAAALPLALFLWFNYASHGNALALSGTLMAARIIDEEGRPFESPETLVRGVQTGSLESSTQGQKTAMGFFKTRNLLNGFYIHLISPDRGVLTYAPVILLGIFGLGLFNRRNLEYANLLFAIIGADILLYSMWGDPWGGWAFGSRYLIPAYAMLGIALGLALTEWKKSALFFIAFVILGSYSVWVNTLGALTSSRNPPQVEVLALEELSGREEKYTWTRNLEYLEADRSKSFVFQEYLGRYLSAVEYHRLVAGFALTALIGLAILNRFGTANKERSYT